jgi:diguanylate cyclase (GGDEF)-like protein/PAS domain S-box-containing protein
VHVLYVEDNATDADLTLRALARLSTDIDMHHVTTLADARQALQQPTGYDLALIDLRLPDGNGMELLSQIREQQLPIAVVMLTGSGDQETAIAALKAGADDYLNKQSDYTRLPVTLQQAQKRFLETTSVRNHRLRILYVEHSDADIDLTRRHLEKYAPHIHLTVVNSAEQALQLLPSNQNSSSNYDAVLLDYRLPGINALEMAKILRLDRGLKLPIVLISGHGSETVAVEALRIGIDEYLTKHQGYLYELPATLEKVQHRAKLLEEQANLRQTSERLNQLLTASPVVLYSLRLSDDQIAATWVSDNITKLLGYSVEEALSPDWWVSNIHPLDRDSTLLAFASLGEIKHLVHEYRFLDKEGKIHWLHDEIQLRLDADGKAVEATGALQDITVAKQADIIQQARLSVFDQLVQHDSLEQLLGDIVAQLEHARPEMRVSILLKDIKTGLLYTGAAPSLPDFYNAAVDGLEPKIGNGSCGTAAALGEPVFAEDIQTHPYWQKYLELTQQAGVAACWSIPFTNENGDVLGTFGIYYDQPNSPSQADLHLITEFSRITGLAVERFRVETCLRQYAQVFESTREGIVITDLTPNIISVNRAYQEMTGYTQTEVVGRNPRILKSGRHGEAFYQTMWANIHTSGYWQGEIWNRRKDGEIYPELLTISTVKDDQGKPSHYVGVLTDISQIKHTEQKLEHLAHYDPLTELPNRLLVQSRLGHALERAQRQHLEAAVLFIDLDRFKTVNDSLGHPVGDELLEAFAQRMRDRLRKEDTMGRLGGDEFLVVLEELQHPEDAAGVAQSLISMLERPFILSGGQEVYVGASIGISIFPGDGKNSIELVQNADAAMYQAKDQGRNTYRFYTPALSEAVNERLEMEAKLRRALVNKEFVLYYQPQVDISSSKIKGVEALVRWQSPTAGIISPARFIPLAEETGLILPLGEWVLRTACTQTKQWLDAGLPVEAVAINISSRQLQQKNIVELVAQVLAETGLAAEHLKLELTESVIMERGAQAVKILTELRDLGVRLAIDDFGTGYSSLAYLKRFPIDELKIDQSFVRDIPSDKNDMEIAATIIAMGRNLNLSIVAEGVETKEQLEFLTAHECQAYQGYLYSRPISSTEFELLLSDLT